MPWQQSPTSKAPKEHCESSTNMLAAIQFNFHGLVSLLVRCPAGMMAFLRSEWASFETQRDGTRSDILVQWMRRLGWRRAVQKGNARNQAAGWYKGCFWRATVSDDDGRPLIHYASVPRSGFLFKDSCLEPLVLQRLGSKGLHGLHASSLLIGRKAWVFCGPPGTGKTVLGLLGVREGHTLLSDDVTLLGDGRVFPYIVPPRLSPIENIDGDLLQEVAAKSASADRVVRAMINYVTLGRMHIPARLWSPNVSSIRVPNGANYPLGGVFFLKARGGPSEIRPRREVQSAAQDALNCSPTHGGSILGRLSLIDGSDTARAEALGREMEELVESGRCFELYAHPDMSTEEWKDVFHGILRTAEEFD